MWPWSRRSRRARPAPDSLVRPRMAGRLGDGDVVRLPGHRRYADVLNEPTQVLPELGPLLTRGQAERSAHALNPPHRPRHAEGQP